MIDTFKQLLTNQFKAAFCTLNICVDRCPDANWHEPVAKYPFSQVVFHTLFFADYYLGRNEAEFKQQAFHHENVELFDDYEQMQDREPTSTYDKAVIKPYLAHCRGKATDVLGEETADTMEGPSGFERRNFSRAELYVYNLRHVYHHAGQLSLRLRLTASTDVPWVGSGWKEL